MKKLFFLASVVFLILPGCADNSDPGPVTDIGIYINEIRSTGGDWLEIYNSTSANVSLSGFKIYDDPSDKYIIPAGSIAASSFFILNCDGTGVDGNASFRLSASGETVYLEDITGNLIDKVTFPALTNGTTYARFPDGGDTWNLTGLATKNKSNGTDQAPAILLVTRTPLFRD